MATEGSVRHSEMVRGSDWSVMRMSGFDEDEEDDEGGGGGGGGGGCGG